jgi:hypothetical protein
VENLRTYPVFHPDHEPPAYLEKLRNIDPEPLVEVHQPTVRTADPELLAFVRDREAIKKSGAQLSVDGEIYGLRSVNEKRGRLRIAGNQWMDCHVQIRPQRLGQFSRGLVRPEATGK